MNNPIRILQIFNQYRYRGGEEMWVEAVEQLAGECATITELRFHSRDWSNGSGPSRWNQARLMGNNPDAGRQLERQISRDHPDICLFHNVIPVASLGIYKTARSLKVPIIQYIHNFRPFSPSGTLWVGDSVNPAALAGNPWPEVFHGGWQGSRLKTLILSWHLRSAIRSGLLERIDHWISPSAFMKEHFVKAGVSEDRISVIPHCHLGEIRESPAEEADYYLFLGRLETDKGVDLLLESWKKLALKSPLNLPHLKIAGTGSLENHVREATRSNSHIHYLGHVSGEQKQSLLDHCRAVIIPSICWESLGLTAYESYASRRPVIASRAGALQETVRDGESGWHFHPGDVDELADAVHRAEQAGTAGREALGLVGGNWLLDHASPDKWRSDFLNVCTRTSLNSRANPT